jgi:hypothetical protein
LRAWIVARGANRTNASSQSRGALVFFPAVVTGTQRVGDVNHTISLRTRRIAIDDGLPIQKTESPSTIAAETLAHTAAGPNEIPLASLEVAILAILEDSWGSEPIPDM